MKMPAHACIAPRLLSAFALYTAVASSSLADCPKGLAAIAKKDYATALKEFTAPAGQGDKCAQFQLGAMYEQGLGVGQDFQETLKWYRLAADQGYAEAQRSIGLMYSDAEGVKRDYAEAIKWFRLAADQGNA